MYSLANQGFDGGVEVNEEPADPGPLVGPESSLDPELSLVIPTKNEAGGIVTCIERAVSAFEELGVRGEIVVSDSSIDETPEMARELGARVVTPDRTGYGYAYQYGFERARGDLIAMGDGDTTYDFEELPALVSRLESTGADMVIGSRLEGEIKPGAMPTLHRLVGNPVLTGFLNAFYDAGVSDAHSGMRVFHRDVLDRLEFSTDGMEFASEMIMEASAEGLTIEEVPITYHEREGEATIDTFRDGWRHVKFMLVNAPSYLFSVPATAVLLGGIGALLVALFAPTFGVVLPEFQTAVAGSLLVVTGYQIAVLALLTGVVGDAIRTPADPVTRFVTRQFTLERGLIAGVALTVGAVAGYLHGAPLGPAQAVTLLLGCVLGVQTVFFSFFLDLTMAETEPPRLGSPDAGPALGYDESEAD